MRPPRGPHSRTRAARALAHALRHIFSEVIRLEAVDKEDWSSANRMDCLKNAVPFERSATGSPLLKTTPRRDLSTLRCSQRTLGIHSSHGRSPSPHGRNIHGQMAPQHPRPLPHGRNLHVQTRLRPRTPSPHRQRRRKRGPSAASPATTPPKRSVWSVRCACDRSRRPDYRSGQLVGQVTISRAISGFVP
jgi:hypothetical protein